MITNILSLKKTFKYLRCLGAKFNLLPFLVFTVLFLLSGVVSADNSNPSGISFTPPAGDYSVMFLSNIFGTVDGVLVGTGSQLLGTMFAIFNAAVISLGGIIIMYTLIVSTMNTAHEGQFLGQKWSSIWVPIRSVTGVALLMPKASGYSMIQIFVMWVCVQGVGAADKIWNTALSYLNQGGVLVQAKANLNLPSTNSGSPATGTYKAYYGAGTILEGQVCMLTLESELNKLRSDALKQKENKQGICYNPTSNIIRYLCDTPFDLVSTVSTASLVKNGASSSSTVNLLPMPNFDVTLPSSYCDSTSQSTNGSCQNPLSSLLNGVCGTIKWNVMNTGSGGSSSPAFAQARTLAVQQMYDTLLPSAKLISSNLKYKVQPCTSSSTAPCPWYEITATDQLGQVTFSSSGDTTEWQPAPGVSDAGAAVLFNGSELSNAVAAYTDVIVPVLRLIAQNNETSDAGKIAYAKSFLQDAYSSGWASAGGYFMRIVLLSDVQASSGSENTLLDTDNSGLDQSTSFDNTASLVATNLKHALSATDEQRDVAEFICSANPAKCPPALMPLVSVLGLDALNNSSTLYPSLKNLLQNPKNQLCTYLPSSVTTGLNCSQNITPNSNASFNYFGYSALYWIANQQLMIQAQEPGQANKFSEVFNFPIVKLGMGSSSAMGNPGCGSSSFFVGCIVNAFVTVILDFILNNIVPYLVAIIEQLVEQLISAVLIIPLHLVTNIFQAAVSAIANASTITNPIVALANMGVLYINSAIQLWIYTMFINVTASADVLVFPVLLTLNIFLGPLLFTWLGIMVSIGFVTAYYAPFLPFMIFTFGVIGWLMAVIEAMVAAPIVALGISSPEGDQALGKAEHAIIILTNVFLRPSMMIIGYIAAIILSYVGVWAMNTGFTNAEQFILSSPGLTTTMSPGGDVPSSAFATSSGMVTLSMMMTGFTPSSPSVYENFTMGYVGYAGVFGTLFCIIIYTWIYWTIVQEAFNLISILPDKVLRWIGGQQESYGQEASRWAQQTQGEVKEAGRAITSSLSSVADKSTANAEKNQKSSSGGKLEI